MRHVIINLSPRKAGTSAMLAKYFADKIRAAGQTANVHRLYSGLSNLSEVLEGIRKSESIVLIGPCYVASYPAETIRLLKEMSSTEGILHGQSLYGFIQGGMPYVHTHEHGINLLENFAAYNEVEFKGGFVMGGGAVLDGKPLDNVIGAKKMVPAVERFIENICDDKISPPELYQNAAVRMPVLISRILAAAMNRKIKKDLKSHGIDHRASSPYL